MYTGPLRSLIDELGRLPGIGPKSAQRIAFHLLKVPGDDARRLADAIIAVKERTTLCEICFNVAESGAPCAVCGDDRRDPEVICVVETRATLWPWSAPASGAATTCSEAR